MRISPINFTGIKNTGYCWVNNELNGHKLMKINLNTQLTQEDKKEYRSLIKKYPDYKNKIASDFANIEFQSDFFGLQGRFVMKLNGEMLDPTNQDSSVWNFVEKTVNKIKNQNKEDFVVNKSYIEGDDCHFGLIYNDDFDRYIDGTNGTIGLFGGEAMPLDCHDDILEIMHNPDVVKSGANYMANIIKGINDVVNKY